MPRTKNTSKKKGYKPRRPYEKKKKYVRKTYKSKAARGTSSLFKSFNSNDPFRPRMNVKLTYTQVFTLISSTGGVFGSQQVFALNSLYDPDITGGGHQPYGYDSMSTLYERYKVNGVLVDITAVDPDNASATIGVMLITPSSTDSLAGLAIQTVKEKPMCVTRTVVDSGSQKTRLKTYIPMHTAFGWTRDQFHGDMENTTAPINNNPGSIPKLNLAVANNRGNSGYSLVCEVKLTYFATFYERKVLSQS